MTRYAGTMRVANTIASTAVLLAAGFLLLGCSCGSSPSDDDPVGGFGGAGADGGNGGSGNSNSGGSGGQAGDSGPDDDVHDDGIPDDVNPDDPDNPDEPVNPPFTCPVTFRYKASGPITSVVVAGEWQGFNTATAPSLILDGTGFYVATVQLTPGLHAYKYVVNGDWQFDEAQPRRKYVGSPAVENSAVKVADCRLPTWHVQSSKASSPVAGVGKYDAVLHYVDGAAGEGPDVDGFVFTLEHNGVTKLFPGSAVSTDGEGNSTVALTGLAKGKYRLIATPKTMDGQVGEPLRLVFWIEDEEFSWKDALIYMVLTDRYRDGDPGNNAAPTPGADPRGDWQGGDLKGVRDSIADGTLDALGIRAIWLTPFQTNPTGAYKAADGYHGVTGYHGYWPIKAREVDPRIGDAAALRDLVKVAHEHGIRILQDFVLNHVHEQHEYVSAHPSWFRTGCVCGTSGCDWTEKALECMFADYMPDINHSVPEANAAFVADAVWWMDEFDLDGLRVDAVKHVEESATRNLAAEVRETFEAAGTRVFLMGETAMGWNDGDNSENYGTISKYIGPFGLDGQFDFVLYHGVSYRTFANEEKGMIHADYWVKDGLMNYPADAIMTPYIGSHDEPRFVTRADPANNAKAGNQWDDIAGAPSSSLPFERARVGFAWLMNLPGAPLLYYGDEYGQWGGADPNNRLLWKPESSLNADETATLSFVRKLGTVRKDVLALRRGTYFSLQDYVPASQREDTLVFGRKLPAGKSAVVGISRSNTPQTIANIAVDAGTLGFSNGTVLKDYLGGTGVTVVGGYIAITVPAKGAVVLAP